MPIRSIKQYSDRGKISNLSKIHEQEDPPTSFELRSKKMFELAQKTNDKELMAATGFITTDYIDDKNAIPLSAYRLRKIIDDIKSKSGNQIDELSNIFQQCIGFEKSPDAIAYWNNKQAMIKNASARTPSFWRASKNK